MRKSEHFSALLHAQGIPLMVLTNKDPLLEYRLLVAPAFEEMDGDIKRDVIPHMDGILGQFALLWPAALS